MKISGIDKDFEDIIYYLDNNGFRPFASCDGVEANHIEPSKVGNAYIAFLKSPKIISLMAEFLKDKENFRITLGSDGHVKPTELYGNIISGINYKVTFSNRSGERTEYFKSFIKNIVERGEISQCDEKRKLDTIERVLEENSNSDLTFEVLLNGEYQPTMGKTGNINQLIITTKMGEGRVDGNVMFYTERDMDVLASILSNKYGMSKMIDDLEEYPETEFIYSRFDKCMCSIYFTDEHLPQILEQVQYSAQIAHMLPSFESREWIGSDEELLKEYDEDDWDME